MKKYFFNEDGTIKLTRAIILVDVLTFFLLLLIFMGQFKNQDLTPRVTTTTKKVTTTTIKICKNCSIKFNRESLLLEPNSSYPLEDLVDLKGVDIFNVKFSLSDKNIANIELVDGKISLVVKNTLGSFTLTASYMDLEETLNVSVNTSKLNSMSFKNQAYYVYPNEEIEIDLITDPLGYDITNLDIKIDNTDVAEIIDNKRVKGKVEGMTKISVNNNGLIASANLYVVKTKINIKVRENYLYQEKDIIEYNNKEVELLLQLDGEDKDLTNENINFVINDLGNFKTEVSYVGKSTSLENAYIYRIKCTSISSKGEENNYSLIEFNLSDGVRKEFKIVRKQ